MLQKMIYITIILNKDRFNLTMKRLILSLSVAVALAGCAGNGGVTIPSGTAPVPPLMPADQSKILGPASTGETPTVFQTGNGQLRYVSWDRILFGSSFPVDKFIYRAPNGTEYAFDGFTDPPKFSGRFVPDKNQPTKFEPQATPDGHKLLVCCETANAYFPAGYLQSVRYGAWIGADGQTDLFAGGILANVADMQKRDGATVPTGKASYEVWAFRVKNGSVVASSYNTDTDPSRRVRSLLTVNFNTGKVGGTIKGNADFGPDITFGEVNVQNNTFSGTVSSGGESGQVNGGFFGKSGYSGPAGTEIGGKVTFGNKPELDSVFGGAAPDNNRDRNTTSTDLTPINP
ncbi:hypothetical protein H9Q10_07775 [Eikenella sp. S3360]|uniref:Hemoglobin-haptoglobin-utilization protein n=1 Tax=Eikenella glucosivorans TaxID=2766967 RepID=A0ABS0NB73_9NEIS|nr:transferrin-binding protein-like solute binding protein [Eikenella glucosivorans]MBH5329563.1 hypothetical protein [Eikenella glucosivorans]